MSRRTRKEESLPIPTVSWPMKMGFAVLAFSHVVCPLLFFTNLTRNPYYTQIALLNIATAIAGIFWAAEAFRKKEISWPRLPIEIPFIVFVAVALLSTLFSYVVHSPLRTGLLFEALRVWSFTLVNSFLAFYLPLLFTKPLFQTQHKISIWSDIYLTALWAFGWFFFQSMKDRAPQILFENMWDFYGGILWIAAGIYMIRRTRHGEAMGYFHLIFSVTLLAGLYGLLQYFGRDLIWASLVQPYGGRPVSTFGNPNFLSAYLMLVAPLAFGFALRTDSKKESWGYLFISVVSIVAVLCTLTRSSYIGLFAGFVAMGVFLFKKENTVWLKRLGAITALFILLIVIFPKTPLMSVQSPLARFTEIVDAMRSNQSYGPWHQRLLIWSSAWDMVKERPLFGKGWGSFELFYPFYQGKYLLTELFPPWRTHANNAHNVLMEIWAQLGFVGTGVCLWLLVTLFRGGWSIYRRKTDGVSRFVSASLLAGVVAMMADNFFGNVSLFFAMPAYLFWWNTGALFNEQEGLPRFVRPLTPLFRSCLVALICLCLFVGVYFSRRWVQEVYYFQGFKEARAGLVPASIKSLEKAFDWFAGEVNSNYELGNSYARHARELADKNLSAESKTYIEKAIQAYQAALRANPGYDEIYFNLGIAHLQLGQIENAVSNFETSVFINPLLKDAYAALGNQYVNAGSYGNAARLFDQGTRAFPKDRDMWNNAGFSYSKAGQYEKALQAYRTAFILDPSHQPSWGNLNLTAQILKRHEPLLEFPSQLTQMQQAVGRKDFTAARQAAKRMVELLPDSPDTHLSLGNILFYLRDYPGAIESMKTALRLRPDFVVAHINLGHVYQQAGQGDQARASFETALRFDPSNQEAKNALNQ